MTKSKSKILEKRYAVIQQYGWRPDTSPTQWSVFPIGRETALRIYKLGEKPSNRWTSDRFEKKETILRRFETEDEANAFIDHAKAVMADALGAVAQAQTAERAARDRSREADRALSDAVLKFWAHEGRDV